MTATRPLTRDVVLRAAVAFADEEGIGTLSMRKLGQRLGVEAMSLYNHVQNKDDLLAGMADFAVSEFGAPADRPDWRDSIRPIAEATRTALLRHPWAANLVQSRVTPSEVRLSRADAIIGTLRRAGFSIELAYKAQLAIDSFVYGFVLHEVTWPFDSEQQSDVAADLRTQVAFEKYPYLVEMLDSIVAMRRGQEGETGERGYDSDFKFGLRLLLDGLEMIRLERIKAAHDSGS